MQTFDRLMIADGSPLVPSPTEVDSLRSTKQNETTPKDTKHNEREKKNLPLYQWRAS